MRLRRKRFGRAERVSRCCTIMSLLTEMFSGKYLKKLVGRSDIEDALKRLDKLTQEEARMATAQVLQVTHTVDGRVKAVDDKVAKVIDGTQYIFNQSLIKFNSMRLDGRQAREVRQQIATDVDQVKRS